MQSPGLSQLWTVPYQWPEKGSHAATPELQQEATEFAVQRGIQKLTVTGFGPGCWYFLPSRGLEASLSAGLVVVVVVGAQSKSPGHVSRGCLPRAGGMS